MGRVEKSKAKIEIKVKTVIFIPQTANSQLAKMLREEEKTLERMTGYREVGGKGRNQYWEPPVQVRPLGREAVWEEGVSSVLHQGEDWPEPQPELHQEECGVRDMVSDMLGRSREEGRGERKG